MHDLVKHLSDRERPSDPKLEAIRVINDNPIFQELEQARHLLRIAQVRRYEADQEAVFARSDELLARERVERALAKAKLFESMEG